MTRELASGPGVVAPSGEPSAETTETRLNALGVFSDGSDAPNAADADDGVGAADADGTDDDAVGDAALVGGAAEAALDVLGWTT